MATELSTKVITVNEVFSLFTQKIDMKYGFGKGGKIMWLDEFGDGELNGSVSPSHEFDWFIEALHADKFYDGNYQIWAFVKEGVEFFDIEFFDMPMSIVPDIMLPGKEGFGQLIENFKLYIFQIYIKNKKE